MQAWETEGGFSQCREMPRGTESFKTMFRGECWGIDFFFPSASFFMNSASCWAEHVKLGARGFS